MRERKSFIVVVSLALVLGCSRGDVSRKVDVDLQREFVRAAGNGNMHWMKSFLARGADVNVFGNGFPIVAASRGGHTDAVRFLLDKGADINAKEKWNQTALMGAAYFGHVDTVNLLLGRGADVNAADEGGDTALMWAEKQGHAEVAKVLREAGANESFVFLGRAWW